jgi:hypothetical protein
MIIDPSGFQTFKDSEEFFKFPHGAWNTARKKRVDPLRGAWNSKSLASAETVIGVLVQGACRVSELSKEKAPAVTARFSRAG